MTAQVPRERKRVPRVIWELLVSVGLLAVIAALFVPAYLYAREQARRNSCLGNLCMIGKAMKMYAEDFDNVYPWRVGRKSGEKAWLDLGLVYPGYHSGFRTFFCPGSRERASPSAEKMAKRAEEAYRRKDYEWGTSPYRGEPLESTNTYEVISYSYCFNAAGGTLAGKQYPYLPWTENDRSTVRLLADKKAGVALTDESNHRRDGRNVLYNDGSVRWKPGEAALDPDEDDDEVGDPEARDYTAWWSDPPYYGE